MKYIFNIADAAPHYQRVMLQASVASPGKTIVLRNGIAMVVEPGGTIRDLRAGEDADSFWCQSVPSGDLLVYDALDSANPNAVVVMFRLV